MMARYGPLWPPQAKSLKLLLCCLDRLSLHLSTRVSSVKICPVSCLWEKVAVLICCLFDLHPLAKRNQEATMAPAIEKAKKSPRPATDYERWLGEDDQQLDSVRRYDSDRSADNQNRGQDTKRAVTNEINFSSLVRSNVHSQLQPNPEPSALPISFDDSPLSGRHYPRPTVPDFITLYAALILAILLIRRLHTFLRRSRPKGQLSVGKAEAPGYTDGETTVRTRNQVAK
ncbi:hypothetical protein BDW74DRAFT_164343 [Aspergillus multicolor]|uniref:uncharacterized protein n=1 Tax=Aspergillus multicolor TaxID=41759 RepID=UPI003CCDDDEA